MNETNGNRPPIIEALVLSSPEPLPAKRIAEVVGEVTLAEIEEIIGRLNEKYQNGEASFRIRKVAGGYQLYITEDYAGYVEELHTRRRNARLTRSALETMAIIAYRQPVTKLDIEMIRGVASDSVLHTLLERKLITLSGRAQSVGRPLLYRTTDEFLKYFNLNSLEDLPKMEEIEELISSREPDNQQSLPLDIAPSGSTQAGGETERIDDEIADPLDEDDDISKYLPESAINAPAAAGDDLEDEEIDEPSMEESEPIENR